MAFRPHPPSGPHVNAQQKRFVNERPNRKLFSNRQESLLSGVPWNWVVVAGAFPPFVREAQAAHLITTSTTIVTFDFCLGDTGAMTGHSPSAREAIEEQFQARITLMLPSEDCGFFGRRIQQRFGLAYWQFALTRPTRIAFHSASRGQITGRPRFSSSTGAYHRFSHDQTFFTLHPDGTAKARAAISPPVDPSVTTRVLNSTTFRLERAWLTAMSPAC